MSNVFLDMDNVLFDFSGAIKARGVDLDKSKSRLSKGHVDKSLWTKGERETDEAVQKIMSEPGFFRNLKLLPGARDLWSVVPNPRVLTARPKEQSMAQRVRQEKREAIEEHFGEISNHRFICCLRSEKSNYAWGVAKAGPPYSNILVDDLERNCREWQEANGYAILYQNSEQAVRDLKEIVYSDYYR